MKAESQLDLGKDIIHIKNLLRLPKEKTGGPYRNTLRTLLFYKSSNSNVKSYFSSFYLKNLEQGSKPFTLGSIRNHFEFRKESLKSLTLLNICFAPSSLVLVEKQNSTLKNLSLFFTTLYSFIYCPSNS